MPTSPFTDEHQQLRASVRRFVEGELAPHADEWEADGWFADWVFPRLGELGYLGLSMPTEYGGQGADYWATVVFGEEIVRCRSGSLPMAVAAHTDMALPPVLKFGTEEQKQAYLVPALRGERIACIGITEPEAGSNVAGVRTSARRDGRDWIINGSKVFITNGVRGSFVTMVVRTAPPSQTPDGRPDPWSGISLFLVDTDLPGFEVAQKLDKVGMRASDTALLHLTDVRVPAEALLGIEGQGFKQIMWELQGERLIASIQSVAAAQLTFERSLAYAQEREAFGRPIARFQVQKHRLVDMATEVEACRRLLYDCVDKWNRGEYATTEIAMCKLACAQMAFRVADEAMQLHGGYGYSREFPVERSWRDARLMRIGGGTDEVQREIISKLMGL
ncbi:MAG: acyl-CoA dehydrogenase family protein [Actinobacteria bacterium]|nr:acyl-CoA dehydrogenase family protein [Actinomycetota bacterium]